MKRINKIFFLTVLLAVSLTSCESILDVEADKIVTEKENEMKSDGLYSIFGILSQLQKLADSYVILGELRGDLLEPVESADKYLKEIYNFSEYSSDNPYTNNIGDYYAVINNCNYLIHNVDTNKIESGEKTMYEVISAATAVKAWTYIQLVLNFGEAHYFDRHISTISDALKERTPVKRDELFGILINELLPYQDTKMLSKQGFSGFNTSAALNFPVKMILGDLYLWTGKYEQAATMYRDLMYLNYYTISSAYTNYRAVENGQFTGVVYDYYWEDLFYGKNSSEYVTALAVSNEYERNTNLDSLLLDYYATSIINGAVLVPSQKAIDNFETAQYFHDYVNNVPLVTTGDLRKEGTFLDYSMYYSSSSTLDIPLVFVYKYYLMNNNVYSASTGRDSETEARMILPYRVGLLYLRYAEAVNRLGKPNLAMAVLKNGLNRETLANSKVIPPSEKPNPLPAYMDFTDVRFDSNIGIRSRGLGNLDRDTTNFIINVKDIENATLSDSILYVENLIQEELALETAYEGNRFHDLMRMSVRRGDNSYLANIVALKFENAALQEEVRNRLLNENNWYVKTKN